MSRKSFEMISPLSPAQCAARLSANISFRPLSNPFFWKGCSKPVLGEATPASIYLRKRIMGNNSFQTVLLATMYPTNQGTVITGKCSLHPVTKMVTWVWCWAAVLIGVPVLIHLASGILSGTTKMNDFLDQPYRPEMITLGAFPIYGLMYWVGRGVAIGEDAFLKQFLMQTLQAHEVMHKP